MHKRLYKLFALLLLPVFLVACEHGAENKVDPEVLAATLQKAIDTANTLDNLNSRAYGIARVGMGMASVDEVKSGQALNEAMNIVNQVRSRQYRVVLADLQKATADWPAAEKDQVAGAIDRIEKAVTRLWVVRYIAEGIMKLDPQSAASILMKAGSEAMMIPDPKYRDLDLRSIAALMASADVQAAKALSSSISDSRLRAWSLIEIGKVVSASNPDEARSIIMAAADVARSIPANVKPESALLVAEASAEARDQVLGAEAAKIQAASAHALSAAALAMKPIDMGMARRMGSDAAEAATAIDGKKYPFTRAYAMSNVAIDVSGFDVAAATEMASSIDAGHEDAQAAVLLAVIKAKAGAANPTSILSDINKAENVADNISDRFERAKALAALAEAAIPYSKDKAVEIAGSIEHELGHGLYSFSSIKDGVLADVAIAWAAEDILLAKKIVDPTPEEAAADHEKYIVEPRFANKDVLYTKARAYMGMADATAGADAAAAMKLYTKAAGAALDAGSTGLQWEIAKRMCMLSGDKLFEYAATIESGDFNNQAMALAEIAAHRSANGDSTSTMVWDMAAKAANMLGDDLESSEMLNRVAAICTEYDKDKATEIYAMSMNRVVKIGMAEG